MNYVSPFNNAEVSFRVSLSLTLQSGIFLALTPFSHTCYPIASLRQALK